MPSTIIVAAAIDAGVRSNMPTVKEGAAGKYFSLLNSAEASWWAFLQANAPQVVAEVISAKLRIFQTGPASAGNRTLSATRVTAPWREDTITWKNKPSIAAAVSATATANGAGATGRMVEFDVTADVAKFFSGAWPNHGWAIKSNSSSQIAFDTSEGARPPQLIVQWSQRPAPPTDFEPAGGDIVSIPKPPTRWTFIDLAGDTSLAGVQVQLKATSAGWTAKDGFTTPAFDSGAVASTDPVLDLAQTAYPGLANGAFIWASSRHRDGVGLWSAWSTPETFGYRAHQAVALLSPTAATVADTMFPVKWSAADQRWYEVLVTETDDNGGDLLWTSTRLRSTALRESDVPRGVLRGPGHQVVVRVRVWDSYQRVPKPGAPDYVEVTRTVTYNDVTAVAAVTGLQVTALADRPAVQVTWHRDAAPMLFSVLVDGREQIVAPPATFPAAGSGNYAYTIPAIAKGVTHDVQVKAIEATVVDGLDATRASANSPTVEAAVTPVGVWLVDVEDPSIVVRFLDNAGTDGAGIVTMEMPEVTATFEPVGATTLIPVTSALRAPEGAITDGVLADYGNLTAAQLRTRLIGHIKSKRRRPYMLIWGRRALKVYVSDVNVVDIDIPGGERYQASLRVTSAEPSKEYRLA